MPIMGRSGARAAAAGRAANVRSWRSSSAPSAAQAAGGARSQRSAVAYARVRRGGGECKPSAAEIRAADEARARKAAKRAARTRAALAEATAEEARVSYSATESAAERAARTRAAAEKEYDAHHAEKTLRDREAADKRAEEERIAAEIRAAEDAEKKRSAAAKRALADKRAAEERLAEDAEEKMRAAAKRARAEKEAAEEREYAAKRVRARKEYAAYILPSEEEVRKEHKERLARVAAEKEAAKKQSGGGSSGGNSPVVVTAQPRIPQITLPGTQIKVSQKEWDAMHPIKTPDNIQLTGNAQVRIASQEKQAQKAAAGDHLGAYKESVAVKKAQSAIEEATSKTINPNAEKVTLTEILRTTPVTGDAFTAVQTSLFDARGKFDPLPLVGDSKDINAAYAKRIEGYEAKEGKTGRAIQAASGAIEIATLPLSLVGGAAVGAGVKGASLGLAKAATTKAGQNIVPKLTTPLIKGEGKIAQQIGKYSTPVNIGANSVVGYSIADTSVRIGKKFAESPEAGAREAANAILSLPLAIAGGGAGYKLAEKVAGAIKTRGLTYIPAEKYTVEGIPLSNQLTQDNLAVSFEKNIFYPKPDKFAETNKAIQDVSSSAKLPKHPSQTVNAPKQMYHASNKPFGKEFEVMESKSEIKSIMYGAPKAETYFTRISGEAESKPGLLFNIEPSTGGEILNLKGTTVKKVDYDIAARDLGIPIDKIKASPYLQYKSADYYIQEYGKQGEFYIPGIKAEYEAGTKAGTRYKRLPARYYTEVNGIKVRISEYEPVLTETAAPQAARGKAGKPQKVSYTGYSGKPQEIPVSYSLGVSSKLQTSFKESSRRAEKTTKQVYSSRLGKPSVGSYSSLLGGGKRSTASGVESISSIVYGGNPQRGISSTAYSSKKKKQGQPGQLRKKHDDNRGTDIDFYSAARRGRIDHLSIVDPLEFLGRGSMTNRKRADVTLDKQKIYLVDSNISLTKPAGRRRK